MKSGLRACGRPSTCVDARAPARASCARNRPANPARGPIGSERYASGTIPTSYRFTGQRLDEGVGAPTGKLARGLTFYNSRYYDPGLGRFIQPDTAPSRPPPAGEEPSPGDPQSLNRYSYAANNPLRYVDPSVHMAVIEEGASDCGVVGGCEVFSNDGFVKGSVLSPDVQQAVQKAMNEVRTAADPSMIHLVYDDEGNIDPMATLTASTKIIPILHACALAVGGACSISVGETGYGGGLGERSSVDIWVSSANQLAVTFTLGGGAYAAPQIGGANFNASVNVLPKANINDVGEWFVQVGGSFVWVEGAGGELFFVKTDHGVLTGISGAWGVGGGSEGHTSATYSWYLVDPTTLP